MANIRAMFVGEAGSFLPEDRIVNTFHFSNANAYGVHALAAANALEAFYTDATGSPAATFAVGAMISPWIQRDAELRLYDLSEPEPRIPTIVPITLPSVGSPSGYAEEVALVLSMRGAAPVTPRRRGRIYVGPLAVSMISPGGAAVPTNPTTEMVDNLCAQAAKLASTLSSPGADWSIRSSVPTENFVRIVGGFVDEALDTQRRRGPRTLIRTNWPVP